MAPFKRSAYIYRVLLLETLVRKAFTLIELLVVVSIIALLIAILLPALSSVQRQARITICAAQSRGLGQAQLAQATDNNGDFRDVGNETGEWDKAGVPGSTASLPFSYWINVEARREFENYGVPREYFYCPENQDWNTDEFWTGNGSHYFEPYTVTGYQFFAGRPTYADPNSGALTGFEEVPAGEKRFHLSLDDLAYYNVMVSDLTRYFDGSFHKEPLRASNHIYEDVEGGVTTMPSGTGGTNRTYLDNSTEWVQQNEMGQAENPYESLPQFNLGNVQHWF